MSQLLEALNNEQREAAAQIEGPVMIIAGAGSGKTRTLTYRIAHLLENGVDPFRILALTFTNKAAREMKDRIGKLIGGAAAALWMGTFHSIFSRVLRAEAEKLGYPSSFTIYDTDDSKALLRNIVKEMNLDPKEYAPAFVLGRISRAKSNLISAEEYVSNKAIYNEDILAKKPFIGEIYKLYTERLRRSGSMDFDDLLFNMNVLLRDFPEALAKYQKRFQYILVDEYQDTNYAQYLIVKKLAAAHHNICVVGDDAQSIYSFRGANIQNILNFKADYPEAKQYKLEQNYRSTKHIVSMANTLIKNNRDQIEKDIWTENESGDKVEIFRCMNEAEEGQRVAHGIFQTLRSLNASPKDFAILYRTNSQSRALEDALRRNSIPYRIYGGMSFYKRKEIKDVLAYFRWVVNPHDEEAFLRCINYPARGIGQTSLDRLRIIAKYKGVSLWSVVFAAMEGSIYTEEYLNDLVEGKSEELKSIISAIGPSVWNKCIQVAVSIHSFALRVKETEAFDLGQEILNFTKILKEYKEENTPEAEAKIDNVEELMNALQEFGTREREVYDEETGELSLTEERQTLDVFLQEVSLFTDQDEEEEGDKDKVTLMTVHAAKGLEYPFVFVVGMEENLFPSSMNMLNREELEEERRLFYVALTRSEKKLFLSYAETRSRWGQYTFCEPSRFLGELDPSHIKNPEVLLAPKTFGGADKLFSGDRDRKISSVGSRNMSYRAEKPAIEADKIQLSVPKNLKKVSAAMAEFSSSDTPSQNFTEGTQVRHAKFGKGKVISIEGVGPDQRLHIDFSASGQGVKTILTRFAKLEII